MVFRRHGVGSFCVFALLAIQPASAGDWPTYAHDSQRTGIATDEPLLTLQTAHSLSLLWKSKLKNQSYSLSALTPPIVAAGVKTDAGPRTILYTAGITGTVFAIDAKTGDEVWSRTLRTAALPRNGGLQGTFLCPNGITATPVADKETGLIYVIAPDGSLYGMDLGSGEVRYGPVQFGLCICEGLEPESH